MKVRQINILAMGRCGTHAAVNWIAGHFNRTIEFHLYDFKDHKRRIWMKYLSSTADGITEINTHYRFSKTAIGIQKYNPETVIVVLDSQNIGDEYAKFYKEKIENLFHIFGIEVDNMSTVVVMRTPWNNYASILQWNISSTLKKWRVFINTWLKYAREYLGLTNFFSNKIQFNYDRWFSDVEYRKQLSQSLGLVFSEKGLNYVMEYGKGSSFDGMKYNCDAQSMKVLERWKYIVHKRHRLVKIMRHKTLIHLSRSIFGNDIPEIK